MAQRSPGLRYCAALLVTIRASRLLFEPAPSGDVDDGDVYWPPDSGRAASLTASAFENAPSNDAEGVHVSLDRAIQGLGGGTRFGSSHVKAGLHDRIVE